MKLSLSSIKINAQTGFKLFFYVIIVGIIATIALLIKTGMDYQTKIYDTQSLRKIVDLPTIDIEAFEASMADVPDQTVDFSAALGNKTSIDNLK